MDEISKLDAAVTLGKLGGLKTVAIHGKEHFKNIQLKSAEAKKRNNRKKAKVS